MSSMKTLFSKILLAQVVAVALALTVATVITRASLNRGFKEFLQQQESSVLQTLAPVLSEVYERNSGWALLRDNPAAWQQIWRASHTPQGGPPRGRPGPRRGRLRDAAVPPPEPSAQAQLMRWMRPGDRGMLRERLFLLDQEQQQIAGANPGVQDKITLEAIEVDGQAVGWIGFKPRGKVLPAEAEDFLRGQIRITAVSLAVALVVAAALAYLLARNVSRPVRRVGETIAALSRGEFLSRARIETLDEIGSLAQHVNQLAETLERNRTSRQRWMADIAHELRTPVAILKGEIEALDDGVRPADERMSVSLHEEVDHLSALIDDLQTLAMSDAGALNIQKEPVDFSSMVRQSVETFRGRMATRRISIDCRVAADVTITADPQRLRQLLQNLLENSSRYVTEVGQVRLVLSQTAGETELLIEDSGPGIEDVQLERLFERFYRVEHSRSRSSGGTGLGLSICKNIVEAHGGSIQAEHSAMGGLKIRIVLPA